MPTPAAFDAAINPGQKLLPYSFRLFHGEVKASAGEGLLPKYKSDIQQEGLLSFLYATHTWVQHLMEIQLLKNEEKEEGRLSSTWLPTPEGWSHSNGMNLPGRQSNNCSEVQLKSLRALKRKINFVAMHNSDASGVVIQGENPEGWGNSGGTPPKALVIPAWNRHQGRKYEALAARKTKKKNLKTRCFWTQIKIKSNA